MNILVICLSLTLVLAASLAAVDVPRTDQTFPTPVVQGYKSLSPNCAGGLVYDDGNFEAGYTPGESFPNSGMVMRFDPAEEENVLEQVCACYFAAGSDTTLNHTIVVYDDDGPGGSPGTEIASIRAATVGIPQGSVAFFEYDLTVIGGVPLPSGSVYIGIGGWDAGADSGINLCADQSPGPSQPGFRTLDDGDSWTEMGTAAAFPDYANLGVRADVGETGECAPGPTTLCLP